MDDRTGATNKQLDRVADATCKMKHWML